MTRGERCWLLLIGCAVLLIACRSAASVVLDLPPRQPEQVAPEPARPIAHVPLSAEQDTMRPPIETVRNADSVLALLPQDASGNVDWIAAARAGVVEPQRALPGVPAEPRSGFAFDFVFEGPNPVFDALFPHSSHLEWLECRNCHPAVFRYRNKPISMEAINRGEACGTCHGPVAFPAAACFRCHPGMPPTEGGTPSLGDDMVFRRDSADAAAQAFPPARFPHWVHRIRYTCSACHPDAFEMRVGSTPLTMAAMRDGEACGRCHDSRTAFGLTECQRCHVDGSARPGGSGS